MFADGSYEGQMGLPVLIKGTALGNRKNLERVVQTIDYTADAAHLAQQLNHLKKGMNEEAEPYLVETLRGMFPGVALNPDALTNFIRSGMHEVKANLQRDAQRLQVLSTRNNPQLTNTWVQVTKRNTNVGVLRLKT